MATKSLQLIVRDRDRILFNGEVENISSTNAVGRFDILHNHANFISLVGEKLIIRQPGKAEQTIPVTNGVLKVTKNQVEVFLGVKSLASQT